MKENKTGIISAESTQTIELTNELRIEIIEDIRRKKYLSRLNEMSVVPIGELNDLDEDIIDNVRLYKITEMVYKKGEFATDKFTTVFNTLSTYNANVFILMDSDGKKTDFYVGVRNNEQNDALKRSTVTLGETLKNTLIGHFPGINIKNEDRKSIKLLSQKIAEQKNVTSVSVMGTPKVEEGQDNEQFVQGLEKLALAMQGKQYMGLIIATAQSPNDIQILRRQRQELYTSLSPFKKKDISESTSESESRPLSFAEMNSKEKATTIAKAATIVATGTGGLIGGIVGGPPGALIGGAIGGVVAGGVNMLANGIAPMKQKSTSSSNSVSLTVENKTVIDLLEQLDESLKRIDEFDSYGMWNVAGYFVSDDMSSAEIAASNYRSLMNGEKSGRELSAINSWRLHGEAEKDRNLTKYLCKFEHPQFCYGDRDAYCITTATTEVSGKELGLHLGLPRAAVPGLPVIEHAEFGKEVIKYHMHSQGDESLPEDRMTLGKVFDLGKITNTLVELDNKSLAMHTFITGSTGSGKSNTVYQMLNELYQDNIPFLVVEPAKGEYKDVFGHLPDVNVYSTNPNVAEMVNINPFMFPDSIHVLEHVDGLVEIFSVCWTMYESMPAFFKNAILTSYEKVGWDLGSSTFEGETKEYPDFDLLVDCLEKLIDESDFSAEIKSNYRGALITRVRSLTIGLNKFIFTNTQTEYAKLFDKNCILDISRIKSNETKALIMGLMVYILNEYRVNQKSSNNSSLKHITVLEEAHNLLKNTSGKDSELVGKSVEMITQTIAEIRTYGEGFIIVDQSPSSVDIAAIKNTNTKIVLRTPEVNDREAVGKSMGLDENQINEIAKLPKGVAVVYQNDWVNPVLSMVNEAKVIEMPYEPEVKKVIRTQKSARTMLVRMLMSSWIDIEALTEDVLVDSIRTIDVKRKTKKKLTMKGEEYLRNDKKIGWGKENFSELQELLQTVIDIKNADFYLSVDEFRSAVAEKMEGFSEYETNIVCYYLTLDKE